MSEAGDGLFGLRLRDYREGPRLVVKPRRRPTCGLDGLVDYIVADGLPGELPHAPARLYEVKYYHCRSYTVFMSPTTAFTALTTSAGESETRKPFAPPLMYILSSESADSS